MIESAEGMPAQGGGSATDPANPGNGPAGRPIAPPPPNPSSQPPDAPSTNPPQEPAASEIAKMAVATIQRMKTALVRAGAMLQWEADHYFEPALKHLNGV